MTPDARAPRLVDDLVVVLDLDGVLIKANLFKHRAMLSLFSDHAGLQQRIAEYILARGGVPRHEKIAGILSDIVGAPADEAALSSCLERYAIALP